MFDKYIVHLGCQLQSDAPQAFQTCYNQCLLKGDVLVNGEFVKEKYFTDCEIQTVYHDHIAYYNLDNAPLVLDTREKSGNWYRVYAADNVSKAEVKKDVFLLYKPQNKNGDTYAYAVVPGISVEEYQDKELLSCIHVLSNNNVQAVYSEEERKIAAVYYTPGECKHADITVRADQPCILLYDVEKGAIHIAEPEGKIKEIHLQIIFADSTDEITVAFSGKAEDKGKPVFVKL